MRTMKHWALAAMAATALALAGCGGGGSTATAPTKPTDPPPSQPVAAMGTVMLDAAAQAALLAVLPASGTSDTIEIEANGTTERAGVTFSCGSDYGCTVTVTNNLGTITAEWSSQTLGDGTANVMAMAEPVIPPAPTPVAAMGTLTLDETAVAALLAQLKDNGDSAEINIAAGATVTYATVDFTCTSDYACTIMVSNVLGTITAEWSSQTLGDGTAVATAMGPPAPHVPVSTFAQLNPGNAVSVRALVVAAGGTDIDPATAGPEATELTGMGLGGKGAYNANMAGLRSNIDPNSPDLMGTVGGVGVLNGLTDGSMITGETDGIDASDDMAPAPTGWVMKALFRDWGDTEGTGDGGFETGAIVVKNLGPSTTHDWDGDLAERFVNMFNLPGITRDSAADNPYDFTVDRLGADGTVGTDGTNDTVAFVVATGMGITPGGVDSYVSSVFAPGTTTETIGLTDQDGSNAVLGQYLGVSGTYTCGTGTCSLMRDAVTDNWTLGGSGTWQFTPNEGARVSVPDQDWMAYGAWMTTPDNLSGPHRIGTFYNGFDPYDAGDNFTADNAAGLHGTAEYNGGATGVYVDGMVSGLFTATATLTATFDGNGDGTDDATDYMMSGSIHDFRGADGVFLGGDTAAMPNDPDAGGENDWVVLLNASDIEDLATATPTGGSADGLPWAGTWQGSLFGPNMGEDADGDDISVAPSGVAGQFSASVTAIAGPPTVAAGHTAVIGTFGATKDD